MLVAVINIVGGFSPKGKKKERKERKSYQEEGGTRRRREVPECSSGCFQLNLGLRITRTIPIDIVKRGLG